MKILYFNCNKNSYKAGESVTFFWEVENANKIELHPYGEVEAKGVKTVVVPDKTSSAFTVRLIASSDSVNSNIEKEIKLFTYPVKSSTGYSKTSSTSEVLKTSGDTLFSTIIQYLIVSVVAIAFCWIGYNSIRGNTTNVSSKEDSEVNHENSSNILQKERGGLDKGCNISKAYDKTDAKINSLLLKKISDDETLENKDNCSVTYKFFVKQKGYDIDGKEYTEDKILHLFLTYRKIGNNYEFIEGKLFSGVNETEFRQID